MNHAVRTEHWRYIRYANAGDELYDESKDPNEWTNLAGQSEFAPKKAELAKYLPTVNHPDIGGERPAAAKPGNARRKPGTNAAKPNP